MWARPGHAWSWLALTALGAASMSGCAASPWNVEAQGSTAYVLSRFSYDGRALSNVSGSFALRLDGAANSGDIQLEVQGPVQKYRVRWHNFTGGAPHESGGVATNLWLWGDTGNGSGIFPRLFAYGAAFGHVNLWENDQPRRDPTTLLETFPAVAFVSRGEFRDPGSLRMLKSDRSTTFSPATPGDGFVSQIGGQAALYIFVGRGDLYRGFEFHDVRVLLNS